MDKQLKDKVETECSVCKTKFDIWLSTTSRNEEMESNIKNNFHHYCPACRILEDIKKGDPTPM
jgi:hypothetical protein